MPQTNKQTNKSLPEGEISELSLPSVGAFLGTVQDRLRSLFSTTTQLIKIIVNKQLLEEFVEENLTSPDTQLRQAAVTIGKYLGTFGFSGVCEFASEDYWHGPNQPVHDDLLKGVTVRQLFDAVTKAVESKGGFLDIIEVSSIQRSRINNYPERVLNKK
jgi:hypothetical protein